MVNNMISGGDDPSLQTLSAVASSFHKEDDRKAMLRERNREHARLSRQRKRQRLEQLQEENDSLSRDSKAARDECARLREMLERCDHENIRLRNWIDSIISPHAKNNNNNTAPATTTQPPSQQQQQQAAVVPAITQSPQSPAYPYRY